MATYKRIDGDYNITTINSLDNVLITTHSVKVFGNLDVVGNVTYIDTTELRVNDPFITVAANNTGVVANALFQDQGLVAQTSSNTFAGLRFDNGNLTWQISPSVYANGDPIVAYANISSGSTGVPGGANTNVQYNDSGTLGGNANFSFDYATAKMTLNGHQVLGNIGIAPSSVANSVAIYHNEQGSGGTGVYVKSATVEDELVSKTKAIVFGIIF